MKYIHSSETLNVPEGGECDWSSQALEIQRAAPGKIYDDIDLELAHWKKCNY
jgi:hypothetical protein